MEVGIVFGFNYFRILRDNFFLSLSAFLYTSLYFFLIFRTVIDICFFISSLVRIFFFLLILNENKSYLVSTSFLEY